MYCVIQIFLKLLLWVLGLTKSFLYNCILLPKRLLLFVITYCWMHCAHAKYLFLRPFEVLGTYFVLALKRGFVFPCYFWICNRLRNGCSISQGCVTYWIFIIALSFIFINSADNCTLLIGLCMVRDNFWTRNVSLVLNS